MIDPYHFIKLAVLFGGFGFSLGAFILHYHRTQKRVREHADAIADLQEALDTDDD